MNKSYKSIWNESLGTYVAASEAVTSGGRKVSSGRKARRAPERALSSQIVLEQRIVFDAALPATVLDVAADTDSADGASEQTHDEPEPEEPVVAPAATTTASDETPAADEVAADTDADTDTSADADVDADTEQANSDDSEPVDTGATEATGADATAEETADTTAADDLATDDTAVVDADERVEIIFVDAVAAIPDEEADEHFRSQHTFLSNGNGALAVDFVGRYERLADDFKQVQERTGLPPLELPRLQAARRAAKYATYYTPRTRDLVARRYRRDIELFGYEFGG